MFLTFYRLSSLFVFYPELILTLSQLLRLLFWFTYVMSSLH